MLDIYNIVWSKDIAFCDKLDMLTHEKLKLDDEITNQKEYTLDIYFDFTRNLDEIKSKNQKGKQVALALRVIKLIRKGDEKYSIDMRLTAPGSLFIEFFEGNINVSKRYLCEMGINFFANDKYTFKTFILGAYKLLRNSIISDKKYNEFMKLLERKSKNDGVNKYNSDRNRG